ncbi:MAG: hypothetical protein KAS95_00550 [Candidatus Heimdallarchaeota archaeon]|nr:hypothetical protein [Candidatus Heimdallarchaeota archaeon]
MDSSKKIRTVVSGKERVDVLARCLFSLHRWQSRLKYDLKLVFYLSHPQEEKAIIIPLHNLSEKIDDEFEATHLMIRLLSSPEVFNCETQKISFEELLLRTSANSIIYYLTPNGLPFLDVKKELSRSDSLCFVLGSQHDLTPEQESVMYKIGALQISLGQLNYLASHVLTIICHYLFDTLENSSFS